jgi:uncharacterized DUF497 family protein
MFDWDERKAQSNRRKHGVSFEEAATAFLDPDGLDGEDSEHSGIEPVVCDWPKVVWATYYS